MGLCRLCLCDNALYIEIFGPDGLKLNISTVLSEFFWFQIQPDDAISTVVCQRCWYSTSTFQSFHQTIRVAQQSLYDKQPQLQFDAYDGASASGCAGASNDLKPDFIAAADVAAVADTSDDIVESGDVAAESSVAESYDEGVEGSLHLFTSTAGDDGVACVLQIDRQPGANIPTSTNTGLIKNEADGGESDTSAQRSTKRRAIKRESQLGDQQDADTDAAIEYLISVEEPTTQTEDADAVASGDPKFNVTGIGDSDGDPEKNDVVQAAQDDEEEEEEDSDDENDDDADEDAEDEEDNDFDHEDDGDDDDEDLPIVRQKKRRESSVAASTKAKPKCHNKRKDRDAEDARIRRICNIYCTVCQMQFDTFCDLMKHHRLAHDRRGYLACCDRRITSRSRLLEHVEEHLNPDAFKCAVCAERFSGRLGLKKHMAVHAEAEERPHACDACPQRYAKAVQLARHRFNMHSAEADKTHVCEQCDKRFLSAAKLAEHVKRSHDFVPEICDYCGKEFKSIYNLNVHRTEVHMGHEVPRMQCSICGTWLREKYLKKHLKRHDAEVETCTVCGKTLQNKNSLGNHMRNVHGNRMHQCAVCGKTFSKPLSLREHMALHTGQDLYTCPYCPRTFKSGANMHSHRKKFHFEDWSKDRGKRLVTSKYL